MAWLDWLIPYLLVGIIIAEGAQWAKKRQNDPLRAGAYLIIVLLWPLMILLSFMRPR